jgi:hypothetical protein
LQSALIKKATSLPGIEPGQLWVGALAALGFFASLFDLIFLPLSFVLLDANAFGWLYCLGGPEAASLINTPATNMPGTPEEPLYGMTQVLAQVVFCICSAKSLDQSGPDA